MSARLVSREDVVGKPVIDQKGSIIGNAKDLAFSVGTEEIKIALIVESEAGELTIDWSSIKAVNDVILLNRELEVKPPPKPAYIICPECGHKNKPDAKYCARCGLVLKEE